MSPSQGLALAIATGALLAQGACGDGEAIICEGTVVGNTCVPDDAGAGQPDGSGPGPDIHVGDPPDTTPDVAEEPCGPGLEGIKPTGAACAKHCECATDNCYDEAYLGDFRFCTKSCADGCQKGVGAVAGASYVCLILGGKPANEHGLTQTSICQQVCLSLEDCKALGSAYDQCGAPLTPGTLWGESTLAIEDTCQIAAEVN